MAKKEVLRVEHVGMKFNLNQEKVDDLKDYIIKLIKHQISYNEFWALKDVSFSLNKGDRLGILGLNGGWEKYPAQGHCGSAESNRRNGNLKGKDSAFAGIGCWF